MRADVRVIWFRGVSLASTAVPASGGICDPFYVTSTPDQSPPILRSVYLTTTIKENAQP